VGHLPIGKCPTCKGKVKKLISHTSFQLKGSGWYITDYARKGKSGDGKSDDAAKPAAETKSDSKSDSKKSESSATSSDKSSTTSSSTAST
jgi:hypothetical protein